MIHFSAFAHSIPQKPISNELARQWASRSLSPKLAHHWTYARGNLFLAIQGDCPVSRFVHTSPRLALICHTELLGCDDCGDFREANQSPAVYLARLYEKNGDIFARDLHGWFGIVIYDFEQNILKAWTDHFGVRRIVYRRLPEALGIASDLRLLGGFFDQSPGIDSQAVLEYLQYSCIPAPRTIYKNTFRLEPGHWLVSGPDTVARPYWEMSYEEVKGQSMKVWASQTFDAIQSAVQRAAKTLDDSQHLGCFLSGGTDSSSVSGLVGRTTGKPPRTFSIGFEDSRYNEIEFARIAARHFRAHHHEYFVQPQDILDLLHALYALYDEPFGNSSIIPSYYCARLAADSGITHMMAGDGGDELFGGNQRYADDRLFQRYGRIPSWLRQNLIEPGMACMPFRSRPLVLRAASYIRRSGIPVPDRWHSYEFLSSIPRSEVFSPDFLAAVRRCDPLEASRRHYVSARAHNDLNRWLYLDLRITINDNDLRKVTGMCELAGIIPRYPFLDSVLAQFSGTIPENLKVRGRQLRYVFKEAMRELLPREIIQKTKHGFGLPYSIWVGEYQPLKEFTFDVLGSRACLQRGFFRKDLLAHLWSQYENVHRNFYGTALWLFLMLELWHVAEKSAIGNSTVSSTANQ
jgi:asparagine synthase (glutamine-hydrolysing)